MEILSEYFDDEGIKRSVVSSDESNYHVSLYYKEELLRVKKFANEIEAENYAEDWVTINE